MSNWTHVAGVIRVDSFRDFVSENLDFDDRIGKECHFTDPYEIWHEQEKHPEKFLPMGSEGSLHKLVWENPKKNYTAAYTVTIFGDLRDHDDPQEIVDWFKNICSKLWVRNAVVTVDNECNGSLTWTYQEG